MQTKMRRELGLYKSLSSFMGELAFHNKLTRSMSHPTLFAIETTNRCDLDCLMCPRGEMTRRTGVMDFSLFRRTVDQVCDYNKWIVLHGMGEPLLDRDISRKVAYCEDRGIRVELSTNGTFLDEQHARSLLSSGLSRLVLSLDAFTEETYRKIRRRGDFRSVLANLEHFIETKNQCYPDSR